MNYFVSKLRKHKQWRTITLTRKHSILLHSQHKIHPCKLYTQTIYPYKSSPRVELNLPLKAQTVKHIPVEITLAKFTSKAAIIANCRRTNKRRRA